MKAALAFDRSARTVADLKKFWDADPMGAASWLGGVKQAAAKAVPELDAVAAIMAERCSDSMKADKLKAYAVATPNLFEVVSDYGAHQAARGSTIGWTANEREPWPEAPAFTGTLKLVNDQPTLETSRGSFALELGSTNWRDEPETVFLDRTVTIKGFPSADGKSLSIEQFGPGASSDFVSGRLLVEGDKVFVAPNGDVPLSPAAFMLAGLPIPPEMPKPGYTLRAEITDPEFKKLLLGDKAKGLVDYAPAGVILPGKVEVKDGVAVYDHKPDAFYILGRFQKPEVAHLPGGKVLHQIETGYFHKTDGIAPEGMVVPDELKPGAKDVGPKGDKTIGGEIAAAKGEGRRTFFYVNVMSPDATVEGAKLDGERRLEVKWLGRAADLGMHVAPTQKATTIADVAKALPAAGPDGGFAPDRS